MFKNVGQGGGSSEPPEPHLDPPLQSYPVIIVCVRAAIGLARLRVSTCSSESLLVFVISSNAANSQMFARTEIMSFAKWRNNSSVYRSVKANSLYKLNQYIT